MENLINALWSLQTWLALFLGIAIGLLIASLMVMARREDPEDGPKTITIPPVYDEPMGDMVDVKDLMRRYS